MSVSDMFKSDSFDKTTAQTNELPIRSQDMLEGLDHKLRDCDETNHTSNCDANGHLNGSQCDIKPGKHKTTLSTGHLDLLTNTVWMSEEGTRNCSLDFQAKRFGTYLPKTDGTNRSKLKIEHQPLKGRRLLPVPPELEFVEEEDLSENEESSEEDNTDNTIHFSSKDGLDHKKERHQYVSDKLDPDVLHLLEMHLRKQQLVDIKEEGEEEMQDVHINKEKPRSDSYKLFRNISPVLDMVLEEPELEHAGDILEEGSKTPSDIDSDDSSNVYAIEAGLMESLQYDLMSKSSKIDKHEIATILQGSDPDISSLGNKTKQKEGSLYLECKSSNGNIQRKQPKLPIAQMRDSGDLEIIHEDGFEDVGSDVLEEVNDAARDIANIQLVPESSSSGPLPQQHGTRNETETIEALLVEGKHLAETAQVDQSPSVTSLDQDLVSDSTQQTGLEAVTQATHVETLLVREDNSFQDSERALLDAVNADNSSGSPCPALNGNVKPPVVCLKSTVSHVIKVMDGPYPNDGDVVMENDSSEQQDVVDTALSDHLTNLNKDLKVIKETVKSHTEASPEASGCSTADMNTLQTDLEQKILALLQKAHAADCRSSHLQAEAELLFKESIELRNECKSLSKEAAELLSMYTQQGLLHRPQTGQCIEKYDAEESVCTNESKRRNKTTLSFVSKRNPRNKKGESQLQILSRKYDFLREEGPEIIRELHVLQQDLKNQPPHHSKPINVLYKWLWGGLIAGSTIFLALWSIKQLV